MKQKIIMDGDWGSDEMQLAAVLLAHPEKAEVLGATAVFGNAAHQHVLRNASDILHMLHASKIPVYPGAEGPTDGSIYEGDGAHGETGVGQAKLEPSPVPPRSEHAVDYILQQLRENEPGTITITASGPLTNIAQAFQRDPETMRRVKEIVIMGGCTHDIPAHDRPIRRGNITPHGEFNFYMAPQDADTVMQSGLPITLLPMNCTQQLSMTPRREETIKRSLIRKPAIRDAVLGMMNGPRDWDAMKFNASPFMHDVHCALYLIHPELYKTEKGDVTVSTAEENQGFTAYNPRAESTTNVATDLVDADALFGEFMKSLEARIFTSRGRGRGIVSAKPETGE